MQKAALAFTLTLLALNVLGCFASKKVTRNPALGSWSYTVQAPEGTYTGTIVFAETEDRIVGELKSDQPLGEIIVSEIEYEEGTLVFKLMGPESGELKARVTIDGDVFSGSVDNLSYDVTGMVINGTRKSME